MMISIWIPLIKAEEKDINGSQENKVIEIEENTNSSDNGLNLATNAKSAIMIESSTGKIIYENMQFCTKVQGCVHLWLPYCVFGLVFTLLMWGFMVAPQQVHA